MDARGWPEHAVIREALARTFGHTVRLSTALSGKNHIDESFLLERVMKFMSRHEQKSKVCFLKACKRAMTI